jgi:hypothetical protein
MPTARQRQRQSRTREPRQPVRQDRTASGERFRIRPRDVPECPHVRGGRPLADRGRRRRRHPKAASPVASTRLRRPRPFQGTSQAAADPLVRPSASVSCRREPRVRQGHCVAECLAPFPVAGVGRLAGLLRKAIIENRPPVPTRTFIGKQHRLERPPTDHDPKPDDLPSSGFRIVHGLPSPTSAAVRRGRSGRDPLGRVCDPGLGKDPRAAGGDEPELSDAPAIRSISVTMATFPPPLSDGQRPA